MFKWPKKSKISPLVLKEYNILEYRFKKHIANYEEAHYLLKERINEIYSNNNFTYEDYVLRKEKLTISADEIKSIWSSIVIAIALSILLTSFNEATEIVRSEYERNIWIQGLSIIFYIVFVIVILGLINSDKKVCEILNNNYFNTKDYELKLIEDKLNKLDEEYEQKKQGVKK